MRRLLYIPIIHSEVDLGGVGNVMTRQSTTMAGEQRWMLHKETVCKFWKSVAAYLYSLDPHKLKVYQDGLTANGELGRQIVEEAARRGSKNYQLVLELLDRGADLQKTEDTILLLREHENIRKFVQQDFRRTSLKGPLEKEELSTQEYRLQREHLMEKRDKFIAEAIGATLEGGEIGVLFIGAHHRVAARLAADIAVEKVKDPAMVEAYLYELFLSHDDKRLEKLGQCLTSPVSAH